MTEAQCGINMRQRLHKRCSLDPTELVTYNVNFDRFNQRQWNPPCVFDDHATLAFPQFAMADMTIVPLGSYGIKLADGYITSIQHHAIMEEIENMGVADPEFDWDDWNFLHCAFPSDKTVYWYDQNAQPQGWDINAFGPFYPRRIVLITLPSRHRRDTYKVLLEYIPTHNNDGDTIPLPDNFENPFGFTQNGLERIVGYACRKRCKVGYRQAGCCCHVIAALIYLGIYSFDQTQFTTKHKFYNAADPMSNELPGSLARQMYAQ